MEYEPVGSFDESPLPSIVADDDEEANVIDDDVDIVQLSHEINDAILSNVSAMLNSDTLHRLPGVPPPLPYKVCTSGHYIHYMEYYRNRIMF